MALKVGIQLYSVRTEMEKDPFEAIRKVAEIGYKNLEVANSRADEDPGVGFDVPADKLLEILGGFGAHVVSSHLRPIDEKNPAGHHCVPRQDRQQIYWTVRGLLPGL